MMNDSTITKHVGLDVHKDTIAVAVMPTYGNGEKRASNYGVIANRPAEIRKLAKKLAGDDQRLRFYYEAGPCGYDLYRQLSDLGHGCHVVAPSLIPRKPGDRIKNDRRDAAMLAERGRSGDLTAVYVPDAEQEAMRDLTRCREDFKSRQRQARQQLSGFLLRHGRVFTGRQNWTKTHFRWLAEQKFDSPVQQIVLEEYIQAVEAATNRVAVLEKQIKESVQKWKFWPVVAALRALRGLDLIAATTVVAELGDVTRFDSPHLLMMFLGLMPSEHSSGQTIRRGPITKSGNGHVRRVLIEGSWTYRYPARMTPHMKRKGQDAPPEVQAIAWKAQKRLCGRYRALSQRGKVPQVVVTAVARELCGFIWAIYKQVQVMDSGAGSPCSQPAARSGEPSTAL